MGFLRHDPMDELVEAIRDLTYVLAIGKEGITKQDLSTLEYNLNMKLSKIKEDVAKLNAHLNEGLAEITERLNQLVADNQDPEVSDEEFTKNLEAALGTAEKLANVANKEVTETGNTETGDTETPSEPTPTV